MLIFLIIRFSFRASLAVYDGKLAQNGYILGEKFCGSTIPAPIYSKKHEVFIRFQSRNNDNANKGYKLLVEEKGKA